jgi:hypothetical protein
MIKVLNGIIAMAISVILFTPAAAALDDFDLYRYGDTKIEIERTGFIMKFVFYKNDAELNRAWKEVSGLEPGNKSEVRAFTQTATGNDVCVVHMVPPTIWDDREGLAILGHETLHCTYASHQDAAAEVAEKEREWEEKQKNEKRALLKELVTKLDDTVDTIEDLFAEDRRLELEWLKEDYEAMGIVITGEME